MWVGAEKLDLFATSIDIQNMVNNEPLIFEIEQPREVVETPEDARTKERPDRADFLSDKDALARNAESAPDLELEDPFAQGDYKVHELPTPQGPRGADGQPARQEISEERNTDNQLEAASSEEVQYAHNSATDFPEELITKSRTESKPGVEEAIPRLRYDNLITRAPDTGGFSLNTYNWNFAPYMLALKRKIERNIFPPVAYMYMGLISGETTLKFRIYPSGKLKLLEVLEYTGHHTLMETSFQAVENSAPFAMLPLDFPEEYLEVTANFTYLVNRPNNR